MLPGVFSLLSCYDTTSGGMILVGFALTLLNGLKFLTSIIPKHLEEEREVSLVSTTEPCTVIPLARYSSLTRLKHVTAWILRFVNNCRTRNSRNRSFTPLSVAELTAVETLWLSNAQTHCFHAEIEALKGKRGLPKTSCLRALHPFFGLFLWTSTSWWACT